MQLIKALFRYHNAKILLNEVHYYSRNLFPILNICKITNLLKTLSNLSNISQFCMVKSCWKLRFSLDHQIDIVGQYLNEPIIEEHRSLECE